MLFDISFQRLFFVGIRVHPRLHSCVPAYAMTDMRNSSEEGAARPFRKKVIATFFTSDTIEGWAVIKIHRGEIRWSAWVAETIFRS